jgi:hypothetical protein
LNSRYEPVELPAIEYMALMQRWVSSKLDDTTIFPTDPAGVSFAINPGICVSASLLLESGPEGDPEGGGDWIGRRSGFPRDFTSICQTIFLQMFRVYSHLYWNHFVEPFYHLNLDKQLNSCFSHFILVATTLDMLKPGELEPMQALIDLWAANGTFPPESKAFAYASQQVGASLLRLGGAA